MWQIVAEFSGDYYAESFIWSKSTKDVIQLQARQKYSRLKKDLMKKDETKGIRTGII